jgi:UDP-N-acetylmuramoyl-tripeptide--D-alanyl-D-alanine ligase
VIPLRWEDIAALGLGRLDGAPPGRTVDRIHADSRVARPGDLFIALNTGVRYVDEARARGAATLVPDDQHAALAALASLVRQRSDARVVAIVGSTGKTTTKDILGALCAAVVPTVFPEQSQNNEIGLPLTVLRLEPQTEVLVVEMGMRGLGQITELCAVAQPDVVLVTQIGPEHLELVGSVENVARANAEALEALPASGIAVVPANAPELQPFLREELDVRPFDPADVDRAQDGWRFRVTGRELRLRLPFAQRHLAVNTLAALTVYDALGLPLDRTQEGMDRVVLSRWRGEELPLPGGGFVVNDAYNANPASMRAALLDLAERAGARRRVAVLGEMAELGADSEHYHREIGALLSHLGVDALVAVGDGARAYMTPGVAEMLWLERAEGFEDLLRPGDAVLVKASRAVGLEGVPDRIANVAQAWSES